MQVLVVDPQHVLSPDLPRQLGGPQCHVQLVESYQTAADLAQNGRADALIVPAPTGDPTPPFIRQAFDGLLRVVDAQRLAAILVGADNGFLAGIDDDSLIDTAPRQVTLDELRGRLATIDRFQGVLKRMERELSHMQRLGKRLNEHFAEVDQELRLAGRLQHDFLPQNFESIGPASFAALFRPATWVSGDIYDIIRVDESHVAFYVADAIGHGMAAGLLTMFIKKAVVSKRTRAGGCDVLDPGETMSLLNDALASQTLPRCQFVTACYCLLNLDTLVLSFARAGHPHPLWIDTGGVLRELKTQGALLGLFRGEEFPSHHVQLSPGEKIILYTDGLEVAYSPAKYSDDPVAYHRAVFRDLVRASPAEIVNRLDAEINGESGSLHPRDDVTVVALEIRS